MSIQEHWFYVLYSQKDHKLYKGTCSEIESRFLVHTSGGVKSTKHRRPLILIYTRKFESKSEALAYERYVKTIEGGTHLRKILMDLGIITSSRKLCSDG
jgi:putative endonuclease